MGPIMKQSEENVRKLVNINVRAAMLCTKHLLPFLGVSSTADYTRESGKTKMSKLVFVSSVASTRATVAPHQFFYKGNMLNKND